MTQPLSSPPVAAPPSSPAGAVPQGLARPGVRALAADLAELVKSRIAGMVAVTCAAGFVLASPGAIDGALLAHALVGTVLVAMAGGALNQVLERDLDARMRRTAERPIPGGRIGADAALALGVLLAVTGLVQLAFAVNLLTALLGAATLAGYLFVYTPLKRVSSLATVAGAVPGAVPPVMGWTAARGDLEAGAWALFGILFLWQLPHFLAIAWMYRDDYARGGFPMISVGDLEGRRTGRQAMLWAAALVPVSLAPAALGLTGTVYFLGALALSLAFFGFAVAFGQARSHAAARRLLLVSVLYLPAILAVMLADRAAP
jgi:protoheme IX farnesyltransferase